MFNLTDAQIIEKIKNGQIDYFSYIVKKYSTPIFRLVASKIRSQEADDIAQNTFLHFYKAIERFDEERPILPYLYQIARNEVKMFWRSNKKTVPLDEEIKIQSEVENDFVQDDIKNTLKVLDQSQREILLLLSEGYSYQEIAGQFKKPLNTIKTMVRRARLKIIKMRQNENA